jgi:hypothetical protein
LTFTSENNNFPLNDWGAGAYFHFPIEEKNTGGHNTEISKCECAMKALLMLENGWYAECESFTGDGEVFGEIVFNTLPIEDRSSS